MALPSSLVQLPLLLAIVSQFLPLLASSPSSSYYCDWCPRHSTASLVSAVLPPACGYDGDTMAAMDLPHVAAAGADFFRDGAGCGACYQLRCMDRRVCGDAGVNVAVVTGAANRTGFLLAREAFAAMARPDHRLARAGLDNIIQVQFRRIPCEYKKKNLTVRVEEGSRNPGHLAIRFLYQGGQTDIAAVEIAQQPNRTLRLHPPPSWRPMARLRRGRWRAARAPDGPLRLRLVVTAGFGGKWLRGDEAVLPADWRPGQAYDTGIRVTDVALSTCTSSCRARAGAGDDDDDEEEEL